MPLTSCLLPALLALVPPAAAGGFSYVELNTVLVKYVSPTGLVDYEGIAADPGPLHRFVAALAATSPASSPSTFPTPDDQLAYYVNAYNALAIEGVVDRPGITSVDAVKQAFFVDAHYTLGGETTNLQRLEDKVRAYGDPRVHFALNCQSLGCPRLPNTAFEPATLDAQLDAAAREFVTNPKQVHVDGGGSAGSAGTAHLSHLFDWYAKDFAASGGAIAFINAHGGAVPANARIEWVPYDWTLAAQAGRGP